MLLDKVNSMQNGQSPVGQTGVAIVNAARTGGIDHSGQEVHVDSNISLNSAMNRILTAVGGERERGH